MCVRVCVWLARGFLGRSRVSFGYLIFIQTAALFIDTHCRYLSPQSHQLQLLCAPVLVHPSNKLLKHAHMHTPACILHVCAYTHTHMHSHTHTHTHTQEERLEWMEAIKPGSSANLKAFAGRSTLRVTEHDHYQQELRRLQPSPPPTYPPPQLQQSNSALEQSPSEIDPSKSWHGWPNAHRNSTSGRSNSVPTSDEPQPYLEPQYFPALERAHSGIGQRTGGPSLAPGGGTPFNSKSIPRNFKTQGNVGGEFTHSNGGVPHPTPGSQGQTHHPHPPHLQQNGHGYSRNTISHDMRSPPPRVTPRSSTEAHLDSPADFLDEGDDPYQLMMSSPVGPSASRDGRNSPKNTKPKPKPRPRKRESPRSSSPRVNLASPPPRQLSISNDYVELCGDSGATVEGDDGASMVSSINQLSKVIEEGGVETAEGEVPEKLAESFSSSQLQLLINMLQKVQAVQSPQGGGGGGGGGETAGGTGVQNVEATSRLLSPMSPQRALYEVGDPVTLKGNFSKCWSTYVVLCLESPYWSYQAISGMQ